MDNRFLKEEGPEVFSGNELILKGALEAGCALITGYPGSPISDLFDAAFSNRELLRSYGVLAEMANNEALAVARLNGARMAGVRALAAMKSVGLHVAADGLALGNLSEPDNHGGSVVVVGDDPWIESTQINNDSRFLSQHLHMPVLEPSTFQEIKDWVNTAFILSSKANLYITYLLTTPQADGGGTVWAHPNQRLKVSADHAIPLEARQINVEKTVLLPPRTWEREKTLPHRYALLWQEARRQKINTLESGTDFSIGFIASGMPYAYVAHSLRELELSGRYPLLKLGLTYPVDPEIILTFAQQVDAIYVVEEKRAFIETQVAEVLRAARQQGLLTRDIPIWGKQFPEGRAGFPIERGLNVSIVMSKIQEIFKAAPPDTTSSFIELPTLPLRTPTFCPGCPHRDSSSVFLNIQRDFRDAAYMRHTHERAPVDLIFHGETGCFTMLMFEPNQTLMHNYSGMGLGGGTGAGADPFITNKQVVFLGDSTFFHSGLLAISDSLKNNQDITYVILDNKTTAMTGHQPTPGTDLNLMGERTYAQNIEAIVTAMAGQGVPVTRMNPGERDTYRTLLERTVLQDGVKVVIADKECGLVVDRREKQDKKKELLQHGFLKEEHFIQITPEVCEFCMVCTQTTGCPGLGFVDTPDGTKLRTDPSLCVNDGACAKIQACPAFEEVTVLRRQAPTTRSPVVSLIPGAPVRARENEPYYIHIAGVGGQGAGLLSAVLVRAADADDWRVLFTDKKGLAVRNGGVYGQLVLTHDGGPLTSAVPAGYADLVLGLDRLEVLRSVEPSKTGRVASAKRSFFVVNEAVQPTVRMLIGRDKREQVPGIEALVPYAQPNGIWSADLSSQAEIEFGDKRYANLLLLGVAYQLGRLPLSLAALELGVRECAPRLERDINLRAFYRGRVLAQGLSFNAADFQSASVTEEIKVLSDRLDPKIAPAYRQLAHDAVLKLEVDEPARKEFVRHIYELIDYDGWRYAKRYVKTVLHVASRDHVDGHRATRAMINYAHKVMAIKDEVYVAHLLTREEKYSRDMTRYQIDSKRGDRIRYRHFNRPEFVLFGRRWRKSLRLSDRPLRWMAKLKFLRHWWPGWHAQEKAFRDWYFMMVERFEPKSQEEYDLWMKILQLPEDVRGYREIRYPKMDQARLRGDALWRGIRRPAHERTPA